MSAFTNTFTCETCGGEFNSLEAYTQCRPCREEEERRRNYVPVGEIVTIAGPFPAYADGPLWFGRGKVVGHDHRGEPIVHVYEGIVTASPGTIAQGDAPFEVKPGLYQHSGYPNGGYEWVSEAPQD